MTGLCREEEEEEEAGAFSPIASQMLKACVQVVMWQPYGLNSVVRNWYNYLVAR